MAIRDDNRARKRPIPTLRAKKTAVPLPIPKNASRGGLTSATTQVVRSTIAALRCIHATAVTATAALRKQNADLDADVALTLQHGVTNSLAAEIERLERLMGDTKEASC